MHSTVEIVESYKLSEVSKFWKLSMQWKPLNVIVWGNEKNLITLTER
jgi:hypothetical protein